MQSGLSYGETQESRWEGSSAQILQSIKKKPVSQILNGVKYTFSLLCKKRQTFLFGNDRFLCLKGIQSISYARELPTSQRLPFTHAAELPAPKVIIPLSQIENFTNDQERLLIVFAGDKRGKWQFVCPSKICALEWRKRLDEATQAHSEFSLSGFENYNQYLKHKQAMNNQRFAQTQQEINIALASRLKNSRANQMSPPQSQDPSNNILGMLSQSPVLRPTTSILTENNSPQFQQFKNSNNFVEKLNQNVISIVQPSQSQKRYQMSPSKQKQLLQSPVQPLEEPKLQISPSRKLLPSRSQKLKGQYNEGSKTSFVEFDPNLRDLSATKVDNLLWKAQQDPIKYSMTNKSKTEKLTIINEISKMKRKWISDIIKGENPFELMMAFRQYIQKIAQVIISQLPINEKQRIFPSSQVTPQSAVYMIDDILVQIYFFQEENLLKANTKYQRAASQFKNLDYFLGATRNETSVKVLPMVLFQYKGFLGMGKVQIQKISPSCNLEAYQSLNHKLFEQETRIDPKILLDQANCRIVSYIPEDFSMYTFNTKSYFFERLITFLPKYQKIRPLRPELVLDTDIQASNLFNQNSLQGILEDRIRVFVRILQEGRDYIVNSKEISELMHHHGLNMRQIGTVYNQVTQSWLKKIIKADIIARVLKNYFRFDMQSLILTKLSPQERQQNLQAKKVISFLNIVFGNSQSTYQLWYSLNNTAIKNFGVKIWDNDFSDISVPYLLIAIQCHLKIILMNSVVQKRAFNGPETFQIKDFLRFQFEINTYNLDFTEMFETIYECFQTRNFESFHQLCQIITKESKEKITYFQVLRNHDIADQIQQFLLDFTSPNDNQELYSRIEDRYVPSRLLYESKFAEIKWCLKSGKQERVLKITEFVQNDVKRWFGSVHPVLTHLYRLLAQFYTDFTPQYTRALEYAYSSLKTQQALFEKECELLWKDYFLIGKVNYLNNKLQEALKFLVNAKQLVQVQLLTDYSIYSEMCIMLSKCYSSLKLFREAYAAAKDLYRRIRDSKDEHIMALTIDTVGIIKQLLQINLEYQSYERFIEQDFSKVMHAYAGHAVLMGAAIRLIAIPNLKNVLLRNINNRNMILTVIDQIAKIPQSPGSCLHYLKSRVAEGVFPKVYLECLKQIDSVLNEVRENQMLERWVSFNKMANQSILGKISGPISRGFEFIASLTAIFNLLGPDALGDLFLMQK